MWGGFVVPKAGFASVADRMEDLAQTSLDLARFRPKEDNSYLLVAFACSESGTTSRDCWKLARLSAKSIDYNQADAPGHSVGNVTGCSLIGIARAARLCLRSLLSITYSLKAFGSPFACSACVA